MPDSPTVAESAKKTLRIQKYPDRLVDGAFGQRRAFQAGRLTKGHSSSLPST